MVNNPKIFHNLVIDHPSPQSITNTDIDIYLELLVEELRKLWETTVHAQHAATFNEQMEFNMQTMLMWTIHDFPTYGMIVGFVTKGYRGCPICSTHTISCRSKAICKNVYTCQHGVRNIIRF